MSSSAAMVRARGGRCHRPVASLLLRPDTCGARQALRPGVGGGRDGSVRVTFEDKPLLSDIVFLRAWVAVELPRLYNPLTDLLAPALTPRSVPKRTSGPPVRLGQSLLPLGAPCLLLRTGAAARGTPAAPRDRAVLDSCKPVSRCHAGDASRTSKRTTADRAPSAPRMTDSCAGFAAAPCAGHLGLLRARSSVQVLTLQCMRRQEAAEGDTTTVSDAQPGGGPAAGLASAEFLPAAAFAGARPGFAFQAGALGLGYYREGSAAQRGSGSGAGAAPDTSAERAAGTAEVCTQWSRCCLHATAASQPMCLAQPFQQKHGDSCRQHLWCVPDCSNAAAGVQRCASRTQGDGLTAGAAQVPAGWVGMRTVAQLRREANQGAPRQPDSLYRPIERRPRHFNPLKIPTSLQARPGAPR